MGVPLSIAFIWLPVTNFWLLFRQFRLFHNELLLFGYQFPIYDRHFNHFVCSITIYLATNFGFQLHSFWMFYDQFFFVSIPHHQFLVVILTISVVSSSTPLIWLFQLSVAFVQRLTNQFWTIERHHFSGQPISTFAPPVFGGFTQLRLNW